MITPYPPPVARLLELGEDSATSTWMDYRKLGLGPEHVPDLVRMATDERLNDLDSEESQTWAPPHAWRALGQLRAAEAVEPLLELADKLEDGIFTGPELATVFGMLGREAIPPLARVLGDEGRSPGLYVLAIRGLDEIVANDPSAEEEVVPLLVGRLEKWERNDDEVNAYLVDALTEMGAVEAALLMEQAFAANRVDLLMRGGWEDVQEDLGLVAERRERGGGLRGSFQAMREAADGDYPGPAPGPAPRPSTHDARAKKNRRKQRKESRKRNRRRK